MRHRHRPPRVLPFPAPTACAARQPRAEDAPTLSPRRCWWSALVALTGLLSAGASVATAVSFARHAGPLAIGAAALGAILATSAFTAAVVWPLIPPHPTSPPEASPDRTRAPWELAQW
jgi:hypothetical protein